MARSSRQIDVYLEAGRKRTFAGAIDWPGWCRHGRDEAAALQALFDYGPRYAQVLDGVGLGFRAPADIAAFAVIERLAGNTTTDYGAPDVAPEADTRPVDDAELARQQALLRACWGAFDAATASAAGKELSKGPRGGGRDVEAIIRHELGADRGYLSHIGGKLAPGAEANLDEDLARARQAILDGLAAAAHGVVPPRGPRGAVRWPPRYFVRRSAWHVLDHAWEIEDRSA
jgi:hypothetical protein